MNKAEQAVRSRLIKMAASMLKADDFLSPYADDNPKTLPKSVLPVAEKQRERLRLWAIECREIADSLTRSTAPEAGVEGELLAKVEALELDGAYDAFYHAGFSMCKALVTRLISKQAAVPAAPQRLYEAKLLGFGENDRIKLCGACHTRAVEDDFVIFSCALPLPAPPVAEEKQ